MKLYGLQENKHWVSAYMEELKRYPINNPYNGPPVPGELPYADRVSHEAALDADRMIEQLRMRTAHNE